MGDLKVGWHGLGSMGLPMALNLHKHLQLEGSTLRFSNRTAEKGAQLLDAGAVQESTFSDVVRACHIVFTMISADAVLKSLMNDVLGAKLDLDGKIFVDCSTIHPDTAVELSGKLSAAGASFVAAPVFGASPVAAAGRLVFAVAGPNAATKKISPFLQGVMGRRIYSLGEDVRKSTMMKISGNVLLVCFLEAISEAQVFAELNGIGTSAMEDLITENFGPVLGSYSRRLTSGSWAPEKDTYPGFAISLAIKDAKYAARTANELDARLPTLDSALGNLLMAKAYAGENLDAAAMYGVLRAQCGLPFFSENSRQDR